MENPRLSWDGGEIRRETDCLLEENGFENSVPRCLATAISAGLHSTTEADDCSDDTATPTVDRPQLGRSLETAAYLVRHDADIVLLSDYRGGPSAPRLVAAFGYRNR